MDKAFWRAIAMNQYEVPAGFSVEQLTPALLANLGVHDPEMRDYFTYTTLENWIQRDLYTSSQLRAMLKTLLTNLAQESRESGEAGAQGSDPALLRSFSVLTVSEIVKYDNAKPFLRADEIKNIMEQGINYLIAEQDLRGHVPGRGWLHALAHAGDLLGVLARNRSIGESELERILIAIAEKVSMPTEHLYITLEEERLALAVIAILTRNLLPLSFWQWWCRQMAEIEETMHWEDVIRFARPEEINAYHNTRVFLHSIYFQLTLAGYKLVGVPGLIAALTRTLYRLDPGFYSPEVIKIIDPEINVDELRS